MCEAAIVSSRVSRLTVSSRNSWEHTWEICKLVDRPNFGLCLDTFQISGNSFSFPVHNDNFHKVTPATHYAAQIALPSDFDKSIPSPKVPLVESLQTLTEALTPHTSKIFYLQISDGARVKPSILSKKAKEQGIHVLYAWSNEYRPLPFQEGYEGFLPVMNVISAVAATGWRGPWSYEVSYGF